MEVLGGAHSVPKNARGIGARSGRLIAHTEQGDYTASEGLLTWRRVDAANALWSQPTAVPAALRQRIASDYRGRLLTLERLLQDLHGGRLFGRAGVFFMDLAAVAFLILAATGLWMWLVRGGNRSFKSIGTDNKHKERKEFTR